MIKQRKDIMLLLFIFLDQNYLTIPIYPKIHINYVNLDSLNDSEKTVSVRGICFKSNILYY